MGTKDFVVNLLALNGNPVGKARLQREAYLIDRFATGLGVAFAYRNSGPYSSEIDRGFCAARASGEVEVEETTGRYGVSHSMLKLRAEGASKLSELGTELNASLSKIRDVSDPVLELAAAMVFFRNNGHESKAKAIRELKLRKPLTATDAGISKALELIDELTIEIAHNPATTANSGSL